MPYPFPFFTDKYGQSLYGLRTLLQKIRQMPYNKPDGIQVKHFGGMWEATAGGSALCGETPLECAMRELQEETGIESDRLIEIGRVRSHNTFYVEFLCVTDCKKDCVILQDGETIAYKWVSRNELVSMKESEFVTKRMQKFLEELQP